MIGISVEIVFHSDKMNFLFPFNAGTRQDLSEWPLILLNFQLTLNQRVTGSSPVAPTTRGRSRPAPMRHSHGTKTFAIHPLRPGPLAKARVRVSLVFVLASVLATYATTPKRLYPKHGELHQAAIEPLPIRLEPL
jgi:hypothetical protein